VTEEPDEKTDAIIEEVRSRRRNLIARHGGLHKWAAHLRREQSKSPDRVLARPEHQSPADRR
jgi:hypothetical protein